MVSGALAALRGRRWYPAGAVLRVLARGGARVGFWVAALVGAWCLYRGIVTQIHRLALELSHGLDFRDPVCSTGYCDYTMFWLAGCLARHGAATVLYDPVRYTAAAARILPYHAGYWPFVYPPTVLPFFVVLSGFPLVAGYYGFCIAGTAASMWLLWKAGCFAALCCSRVLSPCRATRAAPARLWPCFASSRNMHCWCRWPCWRRDHGQRHLWAAASWPRCFACP